MGKTHNNFHLDESDFNLPKECNFLAFVYAADSKTAKQKSGAAYYQAQHTLDFLLHKLGISYSLKPIDGELPDFPVTKPFDPARSAYVLDEAGDILGMLGEFQPGASKKLKLPDYIAGFEIDTDALAKNATATAYIASSKFPKIEQDISLKVPSASFAEVYKCINTALAQQKPVDTIANLIPIDIYVADGETSQNMSFRLSIASQVATLKSSEVNDLLDAIAQNTAKEFGAARI
jgi:phenylalanyl-tRNA synthetase beta subunit